VIALLDTHTFLWFVLNDSNLAPQAKLTIEDPANLLLISPVSYWEIAIKISAGKYRLNRSYEEFWRKGMQENAIGLLPIELRHTSRLLSLPFHHKDPFDRLLVAQALTEQIPLLSGDPTLDAYGIQRVW
jgi:PIN domain nuclease of toxin-antitoxin system